MRKTIAQVSEDTLKIQAFLAIHPHGAFLTYEEIEIGSGVKMNLEGKAKMRSALRRARREYSPVKGLGIKLASADSALSIVSKRLTSINNATKRGDKTTKLLHEQFFDSLSVHEQRQILFAGAVFGAIRIAAQNGKLLYGKQAKLPPSSSDGGINIAIPKV